jgi:hypothetical protein
MISLLLATVAAVQPAQAVAPQAPGAVRDRAAIAAQVQSRFARLDANRDGFVTRDEAQGARAMPKSHGMKRRLRAERRQRTLDPALQQQRGVAAFDRMDSNRDGAISRAEFDQASAQRIARHAARRANGRGARMGFGGGMFELADANRDGRVSLQEATAAAYQRFDMADVDRDGRLTREERMQRRERSRAAPPRG